MRRRDASLHKVLSTLTAAVHGLGQARDNSCQAHAPRRLRATRPAPGGSGGVPARAPCAMALVGPRARRACARARGAALHRFWRRNEPLRSLAPHGPDRTAPARPRSPAPHAAPSRSPFLRAAPPQALESESASTGEALERLDDKMSALLELLSDPPAPSHAWSAANEAAEVALAVSERESAARADAACAAEADASALRDALEAADCECASLREGNAALQAALENASRLLAEARRARTAAEAAAQEEIQVRRQRRVRQLRPAAAAV